MFIGFDRNKSKVRSFRELPYGARQQISFVNNSSLSLYGEITVAVHGVLPL